MKKFLLFVLGAVSLIILLTQIGPLIGLVVSLAVLWFAFRRFIRSGETGSKILWAAVGLIALCFSIGNVPAIIGIVALAGLYFVYKFWNKEKKEEAEPADPFDNFEKQWKEMH
ncbi:flagellar basal body rod protein [Sporolactobacillus sp. THM19-2]|uniref:lmo0954 family membrane protein n=1 Tax=Sporolactobacillus sp. THM19-2 TaxID=2511171 RepID=UPI0010229C43|nr:flagellar basal body rod protein [Sporolactobacillus sp. THM19-2]RYL88916.1 flagellar basal body rod protein [Sporolactobacillus sp. THM19-2]